VRCVLRDPNKAIDHPRGSAETHGSYTCVRSSDAAWVLLGSLKWQPPRSKGRLRGCYILHEEQAQPR
jgi:hypothetical protein